MTEFFYIRDKRTYVGNCPTWWGKNRSGYTTSLDKAGKYTKAEAEDICRNSGQNHEAWLVEYINSIAHRMVDCQDMNRKNMEAA